MEEKTIEAIPNRKKALVVTGLTRDLPPAHYMIKIESFSLLTDMLSKAGVEKHVSGAFKAGGYTWSLSLYPNGDKKRNGSDHISLYLVLDKSALLKNREVNACFKFFVYDQIRDKYLTVQEVESKRFHAMKSEWGFPQLLPLSTFKDATNGYLVDDCCIFGAEVFVTQGNGKREIFSIIEEPRNKTFEWKIDNFSKIIEESITSQVFTVGERKWLLLLHPKGVPEQRGKCISFFLKPNDNHALGHNVYVAYKLRVKDQLHGSYVEQKVDCALFSPSVPDWGFSKFMPLTDLNNASKGFIVDDSVIVEVEINLLSVVKDLA